MSALGLRYSVRRRVPADADVQMDDADMDEEMQLALAMSLHERSNEEMIAARATRTVIAFGSLWLVRSAVLEPCLNYGNKNADGCNSTCNRGYGRHYYNGAEETFGTFANDTLPYSGGPP